MYIIYCLPEGLGVEASIMRKALQQFNLQHLQSAECALWQRKQVAQRAIQCGCNIAVTGVWMHYISSF